MHVDSLNPSEINSDKSNNTSQALVEKSQGLQKITGYFRSLMMWNIFESGLKYVNHVKNLWSCEELVSRSEDSFLRCLKHQYYRYYVQVSENCKIWTFSTIPQDGKKPCDPSFASSPVVMLHGFLAGLAFFSMNFDNIVDCDYDLYALDLPGYARSSRIQFSEDAEETEKIFVETIEAWRKTVGIDKMIMIGHSFGGYITAAYALAYPQHVMQIVFVDPWGFPDLREEVTAVIESGNKNSLTTPLFALPVWMRIIVMILMPFSPFSFLRLIGSIAGPKVIHMLRPDMTRRYACVFGDDDHTTVSEYIYYTNSFSPTGEEAFRSLAMPLAWAKNPMIKRINTIASHIRLHFIYGSRSWIDFQTGYEVKDILKDSEVNVYLLEGAGHHHYADQPEQFNELMRQILKCDSGFNKCKYSTSSESCGIYVKDISMKDSF